MIMAKAAAVLARAWHRDRRRWWWAATGSLALAMVAVLLVSGLFAGLQLATAQQVGDFYTGDLRITKGKASIAADATWSGDEAELAQQLLGPKAQGRLETELILSRRNLVQAYLEEHDQYQLGGPQVESDATRHFGIGILAGLGPDDPLRDRVRAHLVAGRLPEANPGHVELLLGLEAFEGYLSASERGNLSSWPPTGAELASFGFEATAGYVDNSGFFKNVVRRPATVVGVFTTGLDALDSLTAVGALAAARELQGNASSGAVNAFTVTGDTNAARSAAAAQGWQVEGAEGFANRYLGQLLSTVRALSLLAVGLFLVVPAFLLWHGIQQTLDLQRREIAVLRAIGVGRKVIAAALARLAWRVAATGLAITALVAATLQLVLPGLLEGSTLLPLPLTFQLDWTVALAAFLLVVASTWLALRLARRAGTRQPIAISLRAA